ncbi:hypothetical protein [Rhodopseudomonas sp. BR0M22]|uniref:hypothetical protein n=1 Tax=Rhodopseudomonas sp. BR0M22 TaxID=2269369 RepID=UPI0013DF3B0A|nr:hypothetical protein [Rhodopseudomonas sp. BR0M22]MCD0422656.1 hypothetical protein [Rubrivivax sp. JA1024]
MHSPEAVALTIPTEFFKSRLRRAPNGIPLHGNYPKHYALPNSADDLWRTCGRRLSNIVELIRSGLASKPALVGVLNLSGTRRIEPLMAPLRIRSLSCGTKT